MDLINDYLITIIDKCYINNYNEICNTNNAHINNN
jgi:hypothetical protein